MTNREKIRQAEEKIDSLLRSLEAEIGVKVEALDLDTRNFTTRRVSIFTDRPAD